MTSILPELNIAKTPIYEGLVAARGDPYQVDRPVRGWSLPDAGTDFGAANDILGRLLAQGGSDGQGWVAVVLVGGPAADLLSRQLTQGAMAGLPGPLSGGYGPLAAYQVLQAIQTMQAVQAMQALQNQGQPWSQPELPYAVADDPISASMASNMAAGIVQNALQASSPSGFMYDQSTQYTQYAHQYANQPDPYAASALTPAPAYPGAIQPHPLDSNGHYPTAPQPGMGTTTDPPGQYTAVQVQSQPETSGQYPAVPTMSQPDMGMMPTMAFPPDTLPIVPDAPPDYPSATYSATGQLAGGREREEDSANGRRGRFASAMRELRRR